MKAFTSILFGALLVCGCSQSEPAETGQTEKTNNYSSGNPLTAPTDYLGAVSKAQKNSIKTIELASLQQGIQSFQAGEGRLPESLQEMVDEGYLPRMPEAPNGMKFKYDAASGSVELVAAE